MGIKEDAEYYEKLSKDPSSVGVSEKEGLIGSGVGQFNPIQFGAEAGMTALSGIFKARAAERARKQQLELLRDQSQLNVEMNKSQLQQQLLSGLSSSLSNIMMQRAASRAV